MFRRTLVLTSAAAALLAGLTVAPAAADPVMPELSGLDASVPGHLSGTVSSPGAPYLTFRFAPGTAGPRQLVTLDGDSGTFDLATWGYTGEQPIWIQVCEDEARTSCEDPVDSTETFTALDVAPTVTWSQDTTIGQSQAVTATVADDGGGALFAAWVGSGFAARTLLTAPEKQLGPPNGEGQYTVTRCFDETSDVCSTYPALASPTYTVRRSLGLTVSIPVTGPDSGTTKIDLDTTASGTYDLEWTISKTSSEMTPLTGVATDQQLGPNGELSTIEIPLESLTEGHYRFDASVAVDVPEFGPYTAQAQNAGFRVNRVGPGITFSFVTLSKYQGLPAIYPNVGAPDRTRHFTFDFSSPSTDRPLTAQIRSSQGVLIRTLDVQFSGDRIWRGTDPTGTPVPTGVYTISFHDVDGLAANKTIQLYVNRGKRVTRSWTRTITARASLVDQYVGRCSTLRKPSARGWAGSLGFYSNTKCKRGTWRASAVSTFHGVYLPSADRYLSIRIQVYGGAARARPSSRAAFRLFGNDEKWEPSRLLPARPGLHGGDIRPGWRAATGLVFPDGGLYWGMATANKVKYDVKSFRITVSYDILI